MKRKVSFFVLALLVVFCLPFAGRSETYEDQEFSSRNLVLPESEQFQLGAKLFKEKDKKVACWKSYQTFLLNYPDSPLSVDAQFMVAEAIFAQAMEELLSGNPPDEMAWKEQKTSGVKKFGRGIKKGFEGLKNLGAAVSGEAPPMKEPDRIDEATFSEAIQQYLKVVDKSKKSGLVDTALFRIGECYYNMADYVNALKFFRRVQKDFPQSYIVGESILSAAQCYLPGGDFGSAESEIRKLNTNFPSYQKDPRTQFIIGIILYQEGKYDEALKNLEQIETAEALFYSGQCLIKLGKTLPASAKFKMVIDKFKQSRFAEISSYLIAESFFLSENYIASVQEYKRFLTDYPQSSLREGVLYRIAACHFLRKDYSSARESLNLLINTYPQGEYSSTARYLIGESYRFSRQLKEASFSYGQLIAQQPNSPITGNARFKLGWVTYIQKNYSGALESFRKFLDWNPYHPLIPYAYFIMGNCNASLGRIEDAANDYQQSFDRAPKTELSEAAIALLNRTRYSQGNYGQLTSGYTFILKSLPPTESKWRSISMIYLADSYYRQKLFKEAINVYQSILNLYPHHPTAIQSRDGLSWCYFQLGEFDKSQSEREKIMEVKLPEGVSAPDVGSGSYELANALFNQKKYMQALELYEKYLKEKPEEKNIPEAIYRIGLCYYRQEYYSQAIDMWLDLEKKYPKHEKTEQAVFQVADTYFRAQKYNEAVETYRKILVQYPRNPQIVEANLRIGQSYYNAGNDEKAIEEFDAFLKKFSEDLKAVESVDLLEASFDRLEAVKGELQKQRDNALLKGYVDTLPRTSKLAAEAQFRLARRYFAWKDYAKASVEFEKSVMTYPDSPHIGESQFYTAEALYLQKKYEDAIPAFLRFLQNFPNSEFVAAAYFHLGTSQYNTQNYSGSIEAYQNLLIQIPNSEFASAALFNMALSQRKMMQLAEAADSYTKLALNYPQDPNVNFAMMEVAKIRQELKQYPEAILALKDLEAKIPGGDEQKLEVYYMIGDCYLASGDTEEAIKTLAVIQTMPPQNSAWKLEALRKTGEIYEKQEKWKEAAETYEDAAKIGSNGQVAASFRERAKYLRQTFLGETPVSEPESSKKKGRK